MRIALNLIGYLPGCGGVETYLLNLLDALQRIDRENSYLVLCDEPAAAFLNIFADNFRLQTFTYQKNSPKGLLRGAVLRLTGKDILFQELVSLDVDVMHHPLTILNPPDLPYPSVLTFHDMQQEFFPEFFSPSELKRRRRNYLSSVQKTDAVIAVSAHAGQCLVDRYEISQSKVHVVYSGCNSDFYPRTADECACIAEEYAGNRPFMIYPASTWPHKNHLRLLEALRLLVDRKGFDGDLLLTGAEMGGHAEIAAAITRLDLLSRVRWLGYVKQDKLPCLYNLARLMVFPSLFEGFGLPVVEAMASGCPVVCSASSSLPEVGGEAAIYCDPTNVEDIAEKIFHVWGDEQLRGELRMRGLAQASKFCWRDTAKSTIQLYLKAINKTSDEA